MGTFNLLDAAKNYWVDQQKWTPTQCRFHHISTDEVYGELGPKDPAFTEQTPYHPNSPYSASKASSDHFVRVYHHTYQLPVTLSNCSNNYGPYQHAEKLIPTVIRSCLEERAIPVYGNGKNVRDWLYVEDHCSAVDAILKKGVLGETYNIGGNCELDNLALIHRICAMMDERRPRKHGDKHEKLISFVTDRAGHDWRYAIDPTKISSKLSWQPRYEIQTGLQKTLDFYLKNC
jgi:dTDP-glucose 4,6-dehydratase